LRRSLLIAVVLCFGATSLYGQQDSVPTMSYRLVPGFFKFPSNIHLGEAASVALDSKGNIFIANRGTHPLVEFDSEGNFLRSIDDDVFVDAHSIRFDTDGNMWFVDRNSHIVLKLDPDGRVLMVLGRKNVSGLMSNHGQPLFNRPTDVAFGANGDIFVTDGYGNSRVVKFDKNGKFLKTWGTKGTGPSEFNIPHSIAIDSKGLLYVADRENNRIQIFDGDGNFIRQWDKIGSPWWLCITPGPNQVIYMADGVAGRVLKLNLSGEILGAFGDPGKQSGRFAEPHGLAVGPQHELYVSEILTWRVQKFVSSGGNPDPDPGRTTANGSARTSLLYVTNHSEDTIDVIDTSTNKIVQVLHDIEAPHSVDFSPDGTRVYVSVESEKSLFVLNQKTGELIKKIPLTGMPNTIAVTKDGGQVFVAIREAPGALDVIDTKSLTITKTIPMSPLHDIYATPDGKYIIAGSEEAKTLTVVDVKTEQPVWKVNFDQPVRTMAIETNSDGSTRRIFVNTSFFHGFNVVDFQKRTIVDKVDLPKEPSGGQERDQSEGKRVPSHGMGVAPDGKTLWVNSKMADAVFVYSLPDLRLIGHVLTGAVPDWLSFTSDSKLVYVSNTAEDTVSAIDEKNLKEVARIKTGQQPKRINTVTLP
jgi:YVTN family beta-propeller protein